MHQGREPHSEWERSGSPDVRRVALRGNSRTQPRCLSRAVARLTSDGGLEFTRGGVLWGRISGYRCGLLLDPALAAAEHRNVALIGFAFTLLALRTAGWSLLAEMKREGGLPAARRTAAWWLIHHGAISYAAGCVVGLFFQPLLLLAPLGALGVVAGLALLLPRTAAGWEHRELRLPARDFCCSGPALEVALSFCEVVSEVLATPIADPNTLPMRMLRLARVAAVTLPVLALLYRRLAERRVLASAAVSWGCLAIFAGAALMPAVLCLASWVDPRCKYLLPLPATLVFFACSIAVRLAREAAGRAECFWMASNRPPAWAPAC